jgi:DNA-binding transcriptional regulator GbsR (MarR family)
MAERKDMEELEKVRGEFVSQWGALGRAWGINPTMAQIHAILMTSSEPLSTDQLMERLQISRGNAHGNLRDLVGWGLIHSVIRPGERKELFEAEKDVWRMFCMVARERRRREIEPGLELLRRCEERTKGLKGAEATAFHKQLKALRDFAEVADRTMDRLSRSEKSAALPWALKFFK